MMVRTLIPCVVLNIAVLLPLRPAVGQQRMVVAGPECEAAIRQVSQQRFTNVESAILSVLPRCGRADARATAGAISFSRTSRDTVALLRTYRQVDPWRDADVMQAALGVANDAGASTSADLSVLHSRTMSPGPETFGFLR